MMLKHTELIVFLSIIYLTVGLDLPPNIKKCKREVDTINECLKDAIQDALPKFKNGIPELKFAPLDPWNIPSITIGQGQGAVDVVQNFKNVKMYGLSDGTVETVEVNLSKTPYTIKLRGYLKEVRIEAEYNFNGKILLLPLVGNGNAFVIFENNKVTCELFIEPMKKEGIEYLDAKNASVDLMPGKVKFKFDNLFEGNERLGNEINKVFNENWKLIWEDVKPNYEKALELIVQDVSNKIITQIPYDTLFPVD